MGEQALIRAARLDDDHELRAVRRTVWSPLSEPAPIPSSDDAIFDEQHPVAGFLVAQLGSMIVGYINQSRATPLESTRHIHQIKGLGVLEAARGSGIGQALVDAACQCARREQAHRMTLRLLSTNDAARSLYDRCGFTVMAVLPNWFIIDGFYVDDVWMSRDL
ncbi:GNAT family N-acetyltransferase (plasmid) [Streptomyces sp. NBC_00161]|uniref:GNAT family N-acetyltransferase n=1 Tax=Streptomyces sp. NBC_00161 TaxID=2975671 RepID=UPI002F91024F